MTQKYRHGDIQFNLAPMIDVVFLLIIFFTLVSTFASAENIPLKLPNPDKSQAKNVKIVDRVVLNCQLGNATTGTMLTSVGPNPPEPLERIAERLEAAKASNPKLKVIIRADKRLRYDKVRQVLNMVAASKIEHIVLVAHVAAGD